MAGKCMKTNGGFFPPSVGLFYRHQGRECKEVLIVVQIVVVVLVLALVVMTN